jgi:NADPH-dependent 2,4-dienoyl-CoA reductase/sulfur reductase-like enzyme/nitrite reductase/ring-hydroxylating ferredoxin subunit
MSDTSPDPPSGVDLALGIAETDLSDGAMLAGHAHGEPVLLARVGDAVHAIGAKCTHWSGPLAEGLLVDGQVRCPWHHACFDLATGEAVRAPALEPVPCFAVERSGGRITVGERIQRRRAAPPRRAGEPSRIVIVGAGAAGNAAAEMLRREGFQGTIALVGMESDLPYDRPNLSKDYLAGNAQEAWIPLRSRPFYAEHAIDLVLDAEAVQIDRAARSVRLASGRTVPYDRLLLATGAEPIRPPIPGGGLPHVHMLRTFNDSKAIIAALHAARTAVVVGASFIGLEVAASLRARGLAVSVAAPERVPFEKVLGAEVGQWVKQVHLEHGVAFHLGLGVESIIGREVALSDGSRLPADLVVMGVGVRPRLALAEGAGLTIDGGVAVDRELRTSDPDIFAAGDIARYPDPRSGERVRIEHWVVAERQGQTAARNMLGGSEPFDAVPFFWSSHYDTSISYVGHAPGWDDARIDGDLAARDATVTYSRDGSVLAVATVGRDRAALEAEVAMESGWR